VYFPVRTLLRKILWMSETIAIIPLELDTWRRSLNIDGKMQAQNIYNGGPWRDVGVGNLGGGSVADCSVSASRVKSFYYYSIVGRASRNQQVYPKLHVAIFLKIKIAFSMFGKKI
jgi:hypothetical protein